MPTVKVILVGNAGVGKTSIIKRLTEDVFDNNSQATVGSSNAFYQVQNKNGEVVSMKIWDTAGQERYRSLIPMFFNDTGLAFIVFDLTNEDSFSAIESFYKLLEENAPKDIKYVLVGSKNDLQDVRKISSSVAQNYANTIGASFYSECSAKDGNGIKEMFKQAADIQGIPFEPEIPGLIEEIEEGATQEPEPQQGCC
ncbi:small GTP-binding protein [Histomonas meleagridis]|uniref:small GTP-binding protein n=1 Tax=Histomonas meleagridis TaxID=135588 RepID=UPI0035598F38|nr:small GTP-binding protein [Histomonas meleagridis]KAH0806986.1 small GTP-binding protein [Histomonas meleagridis]